MRSTVIGVAIGALFLAALFALAKFFPSAELATTPAQIAAKIEPGFSGVRRIGPWVLVCQPKSGSDVPMPFSLTGKAAPAAATPNKPGRCRTVLAFRRKENPNQIILLVTFRLVSAQQTLAVVVRMPPIAKVGDQVALAWQGKGLGLPVASCEKGSCVAGGVLGPQQEATLLVQPGARLVLPPGADGKRIALNVPFAGLKPSIAAMRRAEIGN